MKTAQIRYQLLIIFLLLTSIVTAQTLKFSNPGKVTFNTQLKSTDGVLDNNAARRISDSLFYIALCFGAINITRTMALHPDKAKKVIINWVVGIMIYSTMINLLV